MASMLFLDESGHFDDSEWICLAGYVADSSAWESFCGEWKILLGKYGLTAIHMREIMSPQGRSPAASWEMPRKLGMLTDFIWLIRKHVHAGFACGLNARNFRETMEVVQGEALKGGYKLHQFQPQTFCFARVARIAMNYYDELAKMEICSPNETLALVFDDAENYAMKCYSYLCKIKKMVPAAKERIKAISFACDEQYYPLQAADILAYATCNELKKPVEERWSPTNIFTDLLKATDPARGILYRGELFKDTNSDELLTSLITEMAQR